GRKQLHALRGEAPPQRDQPALVGNAEQGATDRDELWGGHGLVPGLGIRDWGFGCGWGEDSGINACRARVVEHQRTRSCESPLPNPESPLKATRAPPASCAAWRG